MKNIARYVQLIENTLARQDFTGEPEELYAPVSYILSLGGKRLRPALCLAGCELVGGEVENALMPALGIEMFHNFSLVHDDIMDNATRRRGHKTVHEKWNINTAILAGDAMLVKAYQLMTGVDKSVLAPILKTFSRTALEVCEGQQYDLNFEKAEPVSEADYLEMIRLKTSVLLGAALKIGALTGKSKLARANQLYRFGENIGLAFQIQDDLLDVFGDHQKVGKSPGGDILKDKQTLLRIYAWQEGGTSARTALSHAYASDEEKLSKIIEVFEQTGARRFAEQVRERYFNAAMQSLAEVDGKREIRDELGEFAEWLIRREH